MKRNSIILMLMACLSFLSCKREMMSYQGPEAVYFAVRHGGLVSESSAPYRSYTNVEFVKQPDHVQELDVTIKVGITGPVKNYDRPFSVQINEDSTTAQSGVHFEPFANSFTVPANSLEGMITFKVKRTPDMLLENKKIVLQLVPNEHFKVTFNKWKAVPDLSTLNIGADTAFDATQHTINVNDLMVQPAIWRGSVTAANVEAGIWGAFSRKKIELMFDLFNLTYEDFSSEATMPIILSTLISTELSRYLVDQFDAGTPVLEDDGRLMWAGSVPWTSIIGVPYK